MQKHAQAIVPECTLMIQVSCASELCPDCLQICKPDVEAAEELRPWLVSDGRSWSRLVDDILGPTKPFAAR